jgi:hypothetical protein
LHFSNKRLYWDMNARIIGVAAIVVAVWAAPLSAQMVVQDLTNGTPAAQAQSFLNDLALNPNASLSAPVSNAPQTPPANTQNQFSIVVARPGKPDLQYTNDGSANSGQWVQVPSSADVDSLALLASSLGPTYANPPLRFLAWQQFLNSGYATGYPGLGYYNYGGGYGYAAGNYLPATYAALLPVYSYNNRRGYSGAGSGGNYNTGLSYGYGSGLGTSISTRLEPVGVSGRSARIR